MSIRKIVLAAATIAALSPVISNASPEKASAKACASAFATSIAAPGVAPGYKFSYRGNFGGSLADFYPADYMFVLEARDPKTGLAFARARCSADSHGAVIAISAVPLDAKPATLAAQF